METTTIGVVRPLPKEAFREYHTSGNDHRYKKDQWCIRTYHVWMAWTCHSCTWCGKSIGPGESYVGEVWANKQHIWVEKHHYPECPDRLREFEEEARQEWERRDQERKAGERKAA